MIVSFKGEVSKCIWAGEFSKKIKLQTNLHNLARRKLRMLAAATSLETLKVPPNNRLEQLKGKRKGQWSIRINDQWRICFNWQIGNAYNVEITDYHK
jgi:proteic killer suppression protein